MKRRTSLVIICCILFHMSSFAQQNRFLYIQTENRQPFYVSINNAILSSSASGYLIIPKLQEGKYQLNIGFPKNEWPRQVISYNVGKKDEGVLLKNFGGQGWGFYNLQSLETTMAVGSSPVPTTPGTEDDDSFTQVLSEVVNTPDLKIKQEASDPVPAYVPDTKPAQPIATAMTTVTRLSENNNDQGREFTYLADGDTISIFIPAIRVRESLPPDNDKAGTTAKQPADEKPVKAQINTPEDKPIASESKIEDIKPEGSLAVPKETAGSSGIAMVNSDCKGNADDEDFKKLRKKMASEDNEVRMVVVARKAFKSKCYSTSQIKNLSVLFLNDSGRFQFFESAYPFVLDSNNFAGLQSQLTDPYYVTRFEALTRRSYGPLFYRSSL